MLYNYNGCEIYYRFIGKKDGEINLFLHGWGRNGKDFLPIIESFPEIRWLILDFPPFGNSGEIKEWTILTYANMVMCLLDHLGIQRCNLLGHSFGGRVAMILASLQKDRIQKLVLIDSAGMKPKRGIKYHFKVWRYKRLKKKGGKIKDFGSEDYRKLSDDMKSIFNNIVNTFLEDYCINIASKTLIIWGENDTETPLYMAKRINKLIEGSQLVILKNAGHTCFLDRQLAFCETLKTFLEE